MADVSLSIDTQTKFEVVVSEGTERKAAERVWLQIQEWNTSNVNVHPNSLAAWRALARAANEGYAEAVRLEGLTAGDEAHEFCHNHNGGAGG